MPGESPSGKATASSVSDKHARSRNAFRKSSAARPKEEQQPGRGEERSSGFLPGAFAGGRCTFAESRRLSPRAGCLHTQPSRSGSVAGVSEQVADATGSPFHLSIYHAEKRRRRVHGPPDNSESGSPAPAPLPSPSSAVGLLIYSRRKPSLDAVSGTGSGPGCRLFSDARDGKFVFCPRFVLAAEAVVAAVRPPSRGYAEPAAAECPLGAKTRGRHASSATGRFRATSDRFEKWANSIYPAAVFFFCVVGR